MSESPQFATVLSFAFLNCVRIKMVSTPWEQYGSCRWLGIPGRLSGQRVEKDVFLGRPFTGEHFQLGA